MKILIDGDACPAKKEIFKLAKKYQIEVILITSLAHFSDYEDCTYIVVDDMPQAVDLAVMNRTKRGDLVITQDYGLAAIILRKDAYVISPRGRIYREENMDMMLLQRHLAQKERQAGGRTKGPSQYTKDDKKRLLDVLEGFFRRKREIFGENN